MSGDGLSQAFQKDFLSKMGDIRDAKNDTIDLGAKQEIFQHVYDEYFGVAAKGVSDFDKFMMQPTTRGFTGYGFMAMDLDWIKSKLGDTDLYKEIVKLVRGGKEKINFVSDIGLLKSMKRPEIDQMIKDFQDECFQKFRDSAHSVGEEEEKTRKLVDLIVEPAAAANPTPSSAPASS